MILLLLQIWIIVSCQSMQSNHGESYLPFGKVFSQTDPVPSPGRSPSGRTTLPSSPLKCLKKRKEGWAYVSENNQAIDAKDSNFSPEATMKVYTSDTIRDDELKKNMCSYLRHISNMPTCVSVYGDVTKCKCLHHLRDKDENTLDSISEALLNYWELSPTAQMSYQMDKLQYSEALTDPKWPAKKGPQKNFVLPFYVPESLPETPELPITDDMRDSFHHRICSAAWCNLHNIGRTRYGQLRLARLNMEISTSKLMGNTNRRKPLLEALGSIRKKLTWAQDNLACPFATKIVRDVAGVKSLRFATENDEEDLVFLPPHATIRGMWLDWVRERGWDPVQTCKNRRKYKRKDQWALSPGFHRKQEQVDSAIPIKLPDGTVVQPKLAQPVVVYATFRNLWRQEFPHLRVRARGEDTCTDCFKIRNRLRYLINKKIIAENKLNEIGNVTEDLPDEQSAAISKQLKDFFEGDCPETEGGADSSEFYEGTTPEELQELIKEIDKEVKMAEKHVKMHVAQREESKKYVSMAEEDLKVNKPLIESTMMITMDMSQNGGLPSLFGDQCGDFYYMSPLTQFIFGIVNNATHFIDVYVWGEGTANRGADNIVSCLNSYLKKYKIVDGSKLKRLVIIADNCSGQNKNNCVIKYCCWLVEAGWCGEVVLVFLVKGHTKNECDSKFNMLKCGTRGFNIFTEEGLDAAYQKGNENEICVLRIPLGSDMWRGYTTGLEKIYRNIESGQLKKNHIFVFGGDGNSKTSVSRQLYRDEDKIPYDLKPSESSRKIQLTTIERSSVVNDLPNSLLVLPPPGLSAIKEYDLHHKVGALAPEQCKHQYPKPSDKAKETEMKRRKAKGESARASKKAKQNKIELHNIRPTVKDILREMVNIVEKNKTASVKTSTVPVAVESRRTKTKKAKRTKDPNAPKSARRPYNFFASIERSKLKHEGVKVTEVLLGQHWRALKESEKKEYKDLAKEDNERYQREVAVYNNQNQALPGTNTQPTTPKDSSTLDSAAASDDGSNCC